MHRYLENAVQIVREAGLKAKKHMPVSKIVHIKNNGDLVTDGDLLVENIILDFIQKTYPEHGFNSEERGEYQSDSDFIWILDPIDGTKYYARNTPFYSISLALKYQEKLVLGVVYLPETNQLFSAAAGNGATVNEKKITNPSKTGLRDSMICLEIPSRSSPLELRQSASTIMEALIDSVLRIRILGVGSLGLCFTALGGFDAYVNIGSALKYCDYAAGKIILEESGCRFVEKNSFIVAGPEQLNRSLIELLDIHR